MKSRIFFASTDKEKEISIIRSKATARLKNIAKFSETIEFEHFEEFLYRSKDEAIVSCLNKAMQATELWLLMGRYAGSKCTIPPKGAKLKKCIQNVRSVIQSRSPDSWKILEKYQIDLPPIVFVEAHIIVETGKNKTARAFLNKQVIGQAQEYDSLLKESRSQKDSLDEMESRLLEKFKTTGNTFTENLSGSASNSPKNEKVAMCRMIWLYEMYLWIQSKNYTVNSPNDVSKAIDDRFEQIESCIINNSALVPTRKLPIILGELLQYGEGEIWAWKGNIALLSNGSRFDKLTVKLLAQYSVIKFIFTDPNGISRSEIKRIEANLKKLKLSDRSRIMIGKNCADLHYPYLVELRPTTLFGGELAVDFKILIQRLFERKSKFASDEQLYSIITFGAHKGMLLGVSNKLGKAFSVKSEFQTVTEWLTQMRNGS